METDPYFVPTKSSQNKKFSHQLVVHERHKSTKPKNKFEQSTTNNKQVFTENDMKKIRFEVYKFAQSGLDAAGKQKSKLELAVKLGAIPPKKSYKNYKDLMIDQKKEKLEKQESSRLAKIEKMLKNKKKSGAKSKTITPNSKNKSKSILGVYGKVNSKAVKKSK